MNIWLKCLAMNRKKFLISWSTKIPNVCTIKQSINFIYRSMYSIDRIFFFLQQRMIRSINCLHTSRHFCSFNNFNFFHEKWEITLTLKMIQLLSIHVSLYYWKCVHWFHLFSLFFSFASAVKAVSIKESTKLYKNCYCRWQKWELWDNKTNKYRKAVNRSIQKPIFLLKLLFYIFHDSNGTVEI